MEGDIIKDRPGDGDDFALVSVVSYELHFSWVAFDDHVVVTGAGSTVAELLALYIRSQG